MLFLTKIEVGLNQAALMKIHDAYRWHKLLWQAFPGPESAKRDFLFRVDKQGTGFRVLLLSPRKPQATEWGTWQTKQVAPGFTEHSHYLFNLRANPTMRRASDRRRLAIYAEDRLVEWIHRKASASGFRINDQTLLVGAPLDHYFIRNGRRGKHVSVEFSGLLQVFDRALFRKAFQKGIGPAKAFGFGLLMLQPIC